MKRSESCSGPLFSEIAVFSEKSGACRDSRRQVFSVCGREFSRTPSNLLISADVIGFDDRDANFSKIRDRFGGVARL
jgi:hypothetical protein